MEIRTGVFQINQLDDEFGDLYTDMNNGYDLAYYDYLEENKIPTDEADNHDFMVESGLVLIGFRPTEDNNEFAWFWYEFLGIGFELDPDAEYSALVRESVVQVVRSKWAIQGHIYSPCYPNQVDADTEGVLWGYSLPPEMLTDEHISRQKPTQEVMAM